MMQSFWGITYFSVEVFWLHYYAVNNISLNAKFAIFVFLSGCKYQCMYLIAAEVSVTSPLLKIFSLMDGSDNLNLGVK